MYYTWKPNTGGTYELTSEFDLGYNWDTGITAFLRNAVRTPNANYEQLDFDYYQGYPLGFWIPTPKAAAGLFKPNKFELYLKIDGEVNPERLNGVYTWTSGPITVITSISFSAYPNGIFLRNAVGYGPFP